MAELANSVCVHLHIKGRVQGVFYRASTQQQAQALGLVGWVRNRGDGSVEAVVQGDSESVKQLIEWCHKGPEQATVSQVEVVDQEVGQWQSFTVEPSAP